MKRSHFSCLVIYIFIWIEPLLRGHMSYKTTFSLLRRRPLNTGLTAILNLILPVYCVWLSWPWSNGSWIYNYLINQSLWPLKLCVRNPLLMDRCTRYNIISLSLSTTYDKTVFFSGCFPTNKTVRHDITEILLKVPLITITLTLCH